MSAELAPTLPILEAATGGEAGVAVEPLTARAAPDWDAYVGSRPDATLYHLRAWKTVAEQAYEMEAPYLIARRAGGGPVCGVLPLVRVPRPFSPILASGIFGHYGPLLADDRASGLALVNAARAMARDGLGRLLHLKLLGPAPAWLDLATRVVWVTMMLELRGGASGVWEGFRPGLRTQIRRAEKNGLAVEFGPAAFDGFYDVLEENMTRKGAPMYGRPFFEGLLEHLWPHCEIVALRAGDGRVVSGAFIARFNGTMYVPFASSRPAAFKLRANELLWWAIIRRACALGLHTLDLGSSLASSSGLEFKRKWGARPTPVTSALYAPRGDIPMLEPAESPALQMAVKLWARMPRALSRALGPRVIRWAA